MLASSLSIASESRPASRPCRAAGLFLATLLILGALGALQASAATWRSIAPNGGQIEHIVAAPSTAGLVYAHSYRGQIFRSRDGAVSWSHRGPFLGYYRKLTVDPVRPDILYAVSFNGITKSVDGGRTWTFLTIGGNLETLAIAPSAPDTLYLSLDGKIAKSTDGGATWTPGVQFPYTPHDIAVDPEDDQIVYALADGFYWSEDGGATWTKASGLLSADGYESVSDLEIDPSQPGTLYALVRGGRVYKSTDRGKSWGIVWEGPTPPFAPLTNLKVDRSGTVYVLSLADGVYRGTAGGTSWSPVFRNNHVTTLEVDGQVPGLLYLGVRAGGMYRSTDYGSTWETANGGFRELGFPVVAADPNDPRRVLTLAAVETHSPINLLQRFPLRSTNGGATWLFPVVKPEDSPLVFDVAADPSRPGTWYMASESSILKSTDGAVTWETAWTRPSDFFVSIAVAPSQADRLYAIGWTNFPQCHANPCPDARVFRSLDGGATWRGSRVQGLPPGGVLNLLKVDPRSPKTVFAAGPGLFKSADGGARWAKTGRGLSGTVTGLAIDPFTPGTVYASVQVRAGRKIFKSTDGGGSFAPASNGLPQNVIVEDLAADPRARGTVYAATTQGVYVTRNGGRLWTPLGEGLEHRPIITVVVSEARPGVVYAGGHEGLWVLEP